MGDEIFNNDILVKNLISKTLEIYKMTSTRSNKKIKIAHSIIADDIGNKENRILFHVGVDDGEKTIGFENGYTKKCDFSCFSENGELLYIIETKFIFRNCKQNLNNYFEGEFGRAHLLASKAPYFSFTFCLDEVPYYEKDGTISKIENINESHFEKYNYLKHIDNCFYSVSIFSEKNGEVVSSVGYTYKEMINLIKGM